MLVSGDVDFDQAQCESDSDEVAAGPRSGHKSEEEKSTPGEVAAGPRSGHKPGVEQSLQSVCGEDTQVRVQTWTATRHGVNNDGESALLRHDCRFEHPKSKQHHTNTHCNNLTLGLHPFPPFS